jgi:hypothetical protein
MKRDPLGQFGNLTILVALGEFLESKQSYVFRREVKKCRAIMRHMTMTALSRQSKAKRGGEACLN